MFWADRVQGDIKKSRKASIASDKTLIIRDEKTASGRVHVGSMRGVAIHGVISEILSEQGIQNTFLYEINDFDPMDGLPLYLDEKEYREYMGKPLYTIPSPDGKAKNFAEYFASEYIDVIEQTGFYPEYYRASELYTSGKMNEAITLALLNAETIRTIYKKVSGSVRPPDWYPLSVVCESCGKIGTTKTISFDGEEVEYECRSDQVEWARGCTHSGKISPFDGNAKLPWKVEWAAKFSVLGVDIEGAGKDHSTKGGAREIADTIAKEVYAIRPPFDIPYEFFLVGGRKMSSSKGSGSSAREIADLIPTEIFRLALLGKDPKRTVEFMPEGDTVPLLFDWYDRIAEKYFSGVTDDDARLFQFIHEPEERKEEHGSLQKRFLPRFAQIAFLSQLPHIDLEREVENMKGEALTEEDTHEIHHRARYAAQWLKEVAPEDYRFELQEEVPERALSFTAEQKNALRKVLEYIQNVKTLDGQELHTKLHDIRKEVDIEPKEFFSALYVSLLDKESGPKAGWFLSVLDKDFLEKRLGEVSV